VKDLDCEGEKNIVKKKLLDPGVACTKDLKNGNARGEGNWEVSNE